MRRAQQIWILCLLVVVMVGCDSVRTSPANGVPTFPPTNPDSVEVLRVPPKQPNVRLGVITVEPPSSENVDTPKVEKELRTAAARWGANAVVIVADHTQPVEGTGEAGAWYGAEMPPQTERVVIGVAIRYTSPATTPVGAIGGN